MATRIWTGHSRGIVTHDGAYTSGLRLDICDHCVAAGVDRVNGHPLGPVSHGLHRGTCGVTHADLRAAGVRDVHASANTCPDCGEPYCRLHPPRGT